MFPTLVCFFSSTQGLPPLFASLFASVCPPLFRGQCADLGHLALSDFVRNFSSDKSAFTMLVQMLSGIRTVLLPFSHY